MDTKVEERQKDQLIKIDERNTKKKEKKDTEESEQLLTSSGIPSKCRQDVVHSEKRMLESWGLIMMRSA